VNRIWSNNYHHLWRELPHRICLQEGDKSHTSYSNKNIRIINFTITLYSCESSKRKTSGLLYRHSSLWHSDGHRCRPW